MAEVTFHDVGLGVSVDQKDLERVARHDPVADAARRIMGLNRPVDVPETRYTGPGAPTATELFDGRVRIGRF